MNVINVKINFKEGTNTFFGNSLISGDYASTKLVFEFDNEEGTKIFEMKNPSGEVVIAKEIENNELLLAGVDENEQYYSLFQVEGFYPFEVSLYENGSKLTSTKGEIPVQKEEVVLDGEVVEPYLPIFDQLLNEVSNLNIEANKVDHTTTITITKKDGTTYDTLILDGEKGEKGDAGAIKTKMVNELPTIGDEDTIYLVPNSGEGENNYDEYIYINDAWEKLGGIGIEVDLTDYVKNTDYATSNKSGVVKVGYYGAQLDNGNLRAIAYSYNDYLSNSNNYFISKGTLENVITGKGLVSNTNYASLNTSGVVRVNDDFGVGMVTSGGGAGMITSTTKTYANYQSADNRLFVSKGTLENVLNAKIGSIDSVLDAINGEVI